MRDGIEDSREISGPAENIRRERAREVRSSEARREMRAFIVVEIVSDHGFDVCRFTREFHILPIDVSSRTREQP